MTDALTLHGYWRSSAAYRVRIALNLKGVSYTQITHDLRTGAQGAPDYRAIAPQGLVPALTVGEETLLQSPAILEWLEETYAAPPLLPGGAIGRATVRSMAATIGCDIHPLNNLRILKHLREALHAGEADVAAWIAHWIAEGFAALEILIARHGNGFSYGATPTLADCYLVPQVYSAERFSVDLEPYPALMAACRAARALPAFEAAHPSVQPDADTARLFATPAGVTLCRLDDLDDGKARNFVLQMRSGRFHGFVVRQGSAVHGYVDKCPHAGVPLAQQLDDYLTPDGTLIACSWHGALFRIEDGLCVGGPCVGQ